MTHTCGCIAVDPKRAAEAFKMAVEAIKDAEMEFAQQIAEADAKVDASYLKREEANEERVARYANELAAYKAKQARLNDLKALEKSRFWGLDGFEKQELASLDLQIRLNSPTWPSFTPWRHETKTSHRIGGIKQDYSDMHARCAVALDGLELPVEWAQKIFYIEQDVKEYVRGLWPFKLWRGDEQK